MRTFNEHRALRRVEALIEELRHEEPEILNEILPALVGGVARGVGAVVGGVARGAGAVARGAGSVIAKGAQTAVTAGKKLAGGVANAAQAVGKAATDGLTGVAKAIEITDNLSPKVKQLMQTFQELSPEDKETIGAALDPETQEV
jgi:hypothetical protein